jgi:hypothetical protein
VLIGEATNTNFKVFGLIRTGFEPTIYLIAEKIAYLEFKYILIRVYKKRFQAPVMFIIHPHGVGSNQFLSVNIGVIRLLSVITTFTYLLQQQRYSSNVS